MSTCPNCGDSFKPMNSDHLPFCCQGCLLSSIDDIDELRDQLAELSTKNAELSSRVAELTAENAKLRSVSHGPWYINAPTGTGT